MLYISMTVLLQLSYYVTPRLFGVGYKCLTSTLPLTTTMIIAHLLPRTTLAAAVVMRIIDVFK